MVTLPGLRNGSAVNACQPIDINLQLWSLSDWTASAGCVAASQHMARVDEYSCRLWYMRGYSFKGVWGVPCVIVCWQTSILARNITEIGVVFHAYFLVSMFSFKFPATLKH